MDRTLGSRIQEANASVLAAGNPDARGPSLLATHAPGDDDKVSVTLSRTQALALFEWADRFMETFNPTFTHPADAVAVNSLVSELEWALPEVRTAAYPELLRAGRDRVVEEYRAAMDPRYTAWLDTLEYQDLER